MSLEGLQTCGKLADLLTELAIGEAHHRLGVGVNERRDLPKALGHLRPHLWHTLESVVAQELFATVLFAGRGLIGRGDRRAFHRPVSYEKVE